LIAVSSAAVYGSGFTGPILEDVNGAPYSPYGHHKKMMEQLCRSYGDTYGVDYRVARLFSVYGPELKKQLLWDICTRLASNDHPLLLGGSGKELRDWTFVSDVAAALALIAFQADSPLPHQTVNIGTGIGTPVHDIARVVINAWHERASDTPRPQFQFSGKSRPGDPLSLVADPSRLISMGFQWNTSLAAGIDSFVEWFLQLTRR
jgi:UDP-glucose 4-epimerase